MCVFVSLGKSRQWDPWLQRPSCHSKSQSHLWHWAPRSYYLWTFVHHLPGWERREKRECGRGKHTVRMPPFLHARLPYAHTVLCIKRTEQYCSCDPCFAEFCSSRIKPERTVFRLLCCDKMFLKFCVPRSSTLPGGSVPLCLMTRWDMSLYEDDKWS